MPTRPQLAEFMRRMEPNSVAILPSAPEAVAVIAPAKDGARYTLFVRPRDPEREIWDGRRAGLEGAKETYGADAAFNVSEFEEKLADLLNGARNLYYRLG